MKNNTLVTVVVPVYNQEKYLEKAINSVLSQSYRDYQIIVIDDGSTDKTSLILKQYGNLIKTVYQKNSGTSVAWNNAIKNTETDFLVGLDSDDEFVHTTIEKVMQALELNSKADLIYSDYEFIDSSSKTVKIIQNPEPYDPIGQLLGLHDRLGESNNFLPFGHVRLYRRQSLIDIGGYNPKFLYAEDFDLVLRLAERKCKFVHVPEMLYRYRWHDTNKGVVMREGQKEDVRCSVENYKSRNNFTQKGKGYDQKR